MVSTTLGRRNVRNYFQCCIQLEELLYDVEHDLLAIAEFLVLLWFVCHVH